MTLNEINEYIRKNINYPSLYSQAVQTLKLLAALFEENGYISDIDMLSHIIEENDVVSQTIKKIFEYKKEIIVIGYLEDLFDSDSVKLLINLYCKINNINITEPKLLDVDNGYIEQLSQLPLLTEKEKFNLLSLISQGDQEARKKFIEYNLKLVVSIAKRYTGMGLSFFDLVQEGNCGLIFAVDNYHIIEKIDFVHYASKCIKGAIIVAIGKKTRNIQVPAGVSSQIIKYQQTIDDLTKKLYRIPTIEEIATEMGISISKVLELDRLQFDTISLNEKVRDNENGYKLEDFISSPDETPEELLFGKEENPQIIAKDLLENSDLKPLEIEVLKMYYGIDCPKKMTLNEIGKKFNRSYQWAQIIKKRAINKILLYQKKTKLFSLVLDFINYDDVSLYLIDKLTDGNPQEFIYLTKCVLTVLVNGGPDVYDNILSSYQSEISKKKTKKKTKKQN